MSDVKNNLKYTPSHEWVREEDDGRVTVGITDHAQQLLGDLVFVELPEVGSALEQQAEIAVVESVKAASDVYSPVSGEVSEVNPALEAEPSLVNTDPYGEGWLFKLTPSDTAQIELLLDARAYQAQLTEDA